MSGFLVTGSKIVLHFVSRDVPLEVSIVSEGGRGLFSSRLAVKKSLGMLALVGVTPLGELAIPRARSYPGALFLEPLGSASPPPLGCRHARRAS